MKPAAKPRVGPVASGLIVVVLVSAVMIAQFTGIVRKAFAPSTRTVTAQFADAQQIKAGDPVRIHGVETGEVKRVTLAPDGRTALVAMKVKNSDHLYRDARATARWRTLLGGSFIVDVDPGRASSGELGGRPIPPGRTANQVELEDVTSVDQGAARRGLTTMPKELAQAFSQSDAPAGTFRALATVAPSVARGVGALRGTRPDVDLRDLIANTRSTMRALDAPSDVRGLIENGADALGATAAHRDDIEQTVAAGPRTLAQVDRTLTRLDRTLAVADPVLDKLQPASGELAPTLHELHPTVTGATTLLRRATPLIHALRPAVTSLTDVGRNGTPLLDALTPSIKRLGERVFPDLNEVDPQTGVNSAVAAGAWLEALGPGSVGTLNDSGRVIRFPAAVNTNSLELPCDIFVNDPDKSKLIECRSLDSALGLVLPTAGKGKR
jgi:virulence factor Mce-like protein